MKLPALYILITEAVSTITSRERLKQFLTTPLYSNAVYLMANSVVLSLLGFAFWTGSIAAFLLGLKFNYALLSILFGVIIAGAIVTSLCLLGWLGAVIAGVGLGGLAVIGLWKT